MYDITFLWSHPRSLSTAVERIMLERGDMKTFHEPFIYLYYVHDAKKKLKHFDVDPSQPTSYEKIKEMLIETSRQTPIFVKDMCYYVSDYILNDAEFLQSVTNTFLIRDPKKSIMSFYKIDNELTLEEIGLEAQYQHFNIIHEISGKPPVVIDAENIINNTEATIRAYCKALNLPFIKDALSWDSELPDDWKFVSGWHKDVRNSGGIVKKDQGSLDFTNIPKLQAYYEYHAPFYTAMHKYKLL